MDYQKNLVDNIRKELAKIAIDCSAPFFWFRNSGKKLCDINNGTIFFLDTGQKKFAITAYHVYQGYLDSHSCDSNTKAQIHDERFEPTSHIIDYSKELDLITFQIEQSFVENINKKFFIGFQDSWPPCPPEINRGIFFAGYPGNQKILKSNKTISWGIFNGLCIVKTVNNRNISVQFEDEFILDTPDKMPTGYNSAGISGSPLIEIKENPSGLSVWHLGGIIYEASPDYGLMFATRADFIMADGKIKKI